MVDEPALARRRPAGAEVGAGTRCARPAPGWGLHVCCAVPWELVRARPSRDLLSFDVARDGLPAQARRALRRLLRRGGRVAWGALDPVDPGDSGAVAAVLAGAVFALTAPGLGVEEVARRSLLTPGCGTGRLAERRERLVAATLAAAVDGVRAAVRAPVIAARAEG